MLSNRGTCAYLDRSFELQQDWLGDEDLASFGAQESYLCLQQLYLLTRPAATNFEESVNNGVEIHIILVRHRWQKTSGNGCVSRRSWPILEANGAPVMSKKLLRVSLWDITS